MKANIFINNIARETEKALLVNCNVSFNANAPKAREIWMPKSVCGRTNKAGTMLEVEQWFLDKLSEQNAFHGYRMNFEMAVAA